MDLDPARIIPGSMADVAWPLAVIPLSEDRRNQGSRWHPSATSRKARNANPGGGQIIIQLLLRGNFRL